MKHRISSIFIFAGIFLFLIMSMLMFSKQSDNAFADDSTDRQIKSLENELSSIESERVKIQKELNAAKSNKAHQLQIAAQYDNEINTIEGLIDTTDKLIEQYDIQIAELEQRHKELCAEYNKELANFDEMVRVSYMYGDISYVEMIFGATSFSDFLSRLDMASYMLDYSNTVIDDISAKEAEISETTASIKDSRQNLDEYKASKEVLLNDAKTKKGQADAAAKKYGDSAKDAEEALKYYEKSKKQLQNDIAELVAKAREDEIKYGGGKFLWPVNQSRNAYISSGWEYRTNPITKKKEFHNGLDIPAPSGTKIFAVADGVVEKSAWYGGYGECVILSHGSGIRTLYGHCSKRLVKEGQVVKKGDVIALVGTTGMSTGNHLHFTVYESTTAVNPWNYLK